MRRRDFLKWLGLVPLGVVAGAAALWPRDRVRTVHSTWALAYSKEPGYLNSNTAWFLSEEARDAYEGLSLIKFNDGNYTYVDPDQVPGYLEAGWEPVRHEGIPVNFDAPSTTWIDANFGKPGFAEEYLRRWGKYVR